MKIDDKLRTIVLLLSSQCQCHLLVVKLGGSGCHYCHICEGIRRHEILDENMNAEIGKGMWVVARGSVTRVNWVQGSRSRPSSLLSVSTSPVEDLWSHRS